MVMGLCDGRSERGADGWRRLEKSSLVSLHTLSLLHSYAPQWHQKKVFLGFFLLQISGHFLHQEKHMKQEDEAIVYVWLLLQ